MPNDQEKSPYQVGYSRPPKRTQFTKGQSGNPSGRPKGSKNFATTLHKELKARVSITENGTRKTVSKQDAIAKQLVNKGAAGDPRSMPIVLSEIHNLEGQTGTSDVDTTFSGDAAQMLLKNMVERLRRASDPAPAPSSEQQPTEQPTNPLNEGE